MKFSVCIPNYNYERYLGSTIQSVLDQDDPDLEILISDNASTDRSVEIVKGFNDPRIRLHINACNVGFAGNLDRSAGMATGDVMIMLSSDDLMRAGALAAYRKLFGRLREQGCAAIASCSWEVIDAEDRVTDQTGPNNLWKPEDRQGELEELLGVPVYGVSAGELLRRGLLQMRNPFNFAATAYDADLYRRVEGYGGGRLYNPDKWFHWKVLAQADMAYFVDSRLFAYRWHGGNQFAQQGAAGALKFLVDEYVSTLELDAAVLERIGLTRDDVLGAFIEYDIARHGLATLAQGGRVRARRILDFGRATYPQVVRGNRNARLLGALLALGPVGEKLAARAYRSFKSKNGHRADREMVQ
ncbi:MAG: glycosyltransferase family 2 protein [Planctomycetota bacterium]|nr:MAG: glycosyltransferase family 2 protein [Planctomycetota bacterium]